MIQLSPNAAKSIGRVQIVDQVKQVPISITEDGYIGTTLHNADGSPIGVHHPLPTNSDQVYSKDINLGTSTLSAGWIGSITDLFDDLDSELKNETSNNPKVIDIELERALQTNIFGFASRTGDFSNIKISAFVGDDTEIPLLDESTDDTKKTLIIVNDIPPVSFTRLRIEFHTADTVTLTGAAITKALQRIIRHQAISELTGQLEDVNSFRSALKVDTALVHKVGVSEYFHRETGTATTLAVAAVPGDTSITVLDTTGFSATVGINEIKLQTNGLKEVGVLNITALPGGNVIILDRPLSFDFPIGADVLEVSTNLASLPGTLTSPIVYETAPPEGEVWQLTRTIITMLDGSAMDDGKFGGIPRLINGLALRSNRPGVAQRVVTAWKTNGQIAEDMFDTIYAPKAPAGQYGLRGRWTFTKEEFIVELIGDNGDSAQALVQDDLTDLDWFSLKGKGRLFGG